MWRSKKLYRLLLHIPAGLVVVAGARLHWALPLAFTALNGRIPDVSVTICEPVFNFQTSTNGSPQP